MQIAPEQWPALSRLLDEALELDPPARARWLAALPPPATTLGAALARLLDCHARAETSDFLGALPRLGATAGAAAGTAAAPGDVIGGYVIEAEAGRGGMSVVYRAHRADGLIKRPVALKLLDVGRYSGEALARFARERDILAGLTHPHIARLYDAGATADGQPYIALEFVDGVPLTSYCDARQLDVRARVRLFRQVLEAVQFAHSNLVIHRDLKPSNILVTAGGEVRLLDFGIAKPLAEAGARPVAATEFGGRALTPDYASPEQILGEAVSTASDVYSLGVVLCELLCGSRPYRLKRRSAAVLEEAILDADPVPPSAAAPAAGAAAARASTPRALARALAGDLDSIVLKALRKRPAERYATADAFDQDLDRWLRGEAVLARPDGAWYRTRRFLWHHRYATGTALAVFVALAAGLGVALWQARRAETEARTATAVEAFMARIFAASGTEQADPLKAQQTTARELLARGAQEVNASLAAAPEARLRTLKILGDTHMQLGLMDEAAALRRERVALARTLYGPDALPVGYALIDLSDALQSSSGAAECAAILAEAGRILDRHGDHASAERAMLLRQLAQIRFYTEPQQAQRYLDAAIAIRRARDDTDGLIDNLSMLGAVRLYGLGDVRAALPPLQEAARLCDAQPLRCQSAAPVIYTYLGEADRDLGDPAAAERDFRRAFQLTLATLGPDHADAIQAETHLGKFLCDASHSAEGLAVLRSARDRAIRLKGAEDGFHIPIVELAYASRLLRVGDFDAAVAAATHGTAVARRFRPDDPLLIDYLGIEAAALRAVGRDAEARAASAEAQQLVATLRPAAPILRERERALVEEALDQGEPALAARRAAQAGLLDALRPGAFTFRDVREVLLSARAALESGDPRAALRIAGGLRARAEREPHPDYQRVTVASAAVIEGRAHLALGEAAAAEPLLAAAAGTLAALYDAGRSPVVADAWVALAESHRLRGERAEARQLLRRAQRVDATHPALGRRWLAPLRALEHELGA